MPKKIEKLKDIGSYIIAEYCKMLWQYKRYL